MNRRAFALCSLFAGGAAFAASALAASEGQGPAGVSGPPRWLDVTVKQPITVATQEYLAAALAHASTERLDGVLVRLDTPGGALEATRGIVQSFLASDVPIVVYVSPAGARAGSAGVFITEAAHIAAMDPSSNIGAAHPVSSSGGDVEKEGGKDMAKKVENDTAAFARSIATTRGRNVDWAEKAVRESVSATASEALKLKAIDFIAKDLADLEAQADGRKIELPSGPRTLRFKGATLEPFGMSVRQWILSLLSDPSIAAMLMLLGMAGIGFEFYHPGEFYPGGIGGVLLILGLLATQVIPVNLGAILLIGVGAALLITETFVSVHGAAGIGGAICLLTGMLLFVDKSSPDYQFDPAAFVVSPLVVWPLPLGLALVMTFVAIQVAKVRNRPQLVGALGLVGEKGEALTEITAEAGEAFLRGEYWQVRSPTAIAKGRQVEVVAVDGLTAKVVDCAARRA